MLVDTHVLLWALNEPRRLGRSARDLLESPANEVLFSAASIWEVAIKATLNRRGFGVTPGEIATAALSTGFVELPITSGAAAMVSELPMHHRDPFDRLLVAQAMSEPAVLLTSDRALTVYSKLVRLAD